MNYIKNIFTNNKTIFINFTYLSILQFIRIVIPVLLIPILIGKVGLEKYGMIIFAQTIVAYLMIIVNFGFEMSATKQIAINRGDNKKLSNIVSSVIVVQILLFLTLGFIYFTILSLTSPSNNNYLLFSLSFLFILQEIFIPIWFFQGMEKMKYIAIIDSLSRLIYFILIILFINNSDDYLLVPIFRFVGIIIAGSVSIYFIFIKNKIEFKYIVGQKLYYYVRDSLPFFYSKLSNVINERTNILLLGLFVGMNSVAYYDFMNKVISAINSMFGTLIKVLYPHISISRSKRKAKKILSFNLILSIVGYFTLCFFSWDIITLFLGEAFLYLNVLFYYFGITIPLVVIGWVLGDLFLAAFGYSKEYSLSSIYGTIFYLITIIILYLSSSITLYSLIIALVGRLIFLDVYRFYLCKKHKLV